MCRVSASETFVQAATPLGVFTGESANGMWVLNVSDNADFDIGSVRNFSVKVTEFSCTP